MKILQAESFPLLGKRLIEASAGTGKTYTIANLYLRVLLGDHALGLKPVDRILVVTFTRAATEELRGRIRDRIRQLYEDVLRLEQDPEDSNDQVDPYIKALIACTKDNFFSEDYPKKRKLTEWLQANLAQMDESSVFTIHGFCQRILKQFAFDSGVGFESEMILDAQEYLRRAAQDYWRELAYNMKHDELAALLNNVKSPEDIFWKVKGWLQQENIQLLPKAKPNLNFSSAWQQAKKSFEVAAKEWQSFAEQDANDLIEGSGISKKSFTKVTRPKRIKAAKTFFANAHFSGSIPEDVLALGQENLFEKTIKGAAPEHKAFRLIDQLAQHCDDMVAVLPHHMLVQVKTKFWASMEQANLMNPDDLLRLLANALRGSHGEALADHIRQQYPFAMIDEFQDTDSLQYEIFNQVYSKEDRSGLYMIGDPKQAIYSFRGADIFTYLKAAQALSADSRFTLNKNWRSHSDLVAATNTLFARHNEPFVLPGKIEFQPVLSAEKSDAGYFHYRDSVAKNTATQKNKPAPLTLLLNSEVVNRDHGRYNAAQMCAKSIQQLLLKGCLKNKHNSDSQALSAGDIAVLVHNRKQAKLVKENLKKYGINSVFLSRDSVLNSLEARDLLRWLAAIAEPQNERLFRSALACESLAYDAHYLSSLLNDEVLWEAELSFLYELRERFNQRGVMAFIMALLKRLTNIDTATDSCNDANTEEMLAVRLRKQVDGERKLTNFLHLGEILQQASSELGIKSGFYNTDGKGLLTLLRWYTERCQNALLHQSEEQQIRLESDANLVQIVTIHKSKGLQYPVVFLPFMWDEDNTTTRHGVIYHSDLRTNSADTKEDSSKENGTEGNGTEGRNSTETVLTIDTKPNEAAKKKHINEVRAEAMRLLYVALTRAEQACFVQIENIQNRSKGILLNSAIGYLLEQKDVSIDALTERFSDVIGEGKLALSYYNDWLTQLDSVPVLAKVDTAEKPVLSFAKFKGKVWDNWRLTSYSQLAKLDSRVSVVQTDTSFDMDAEDVADNVASLVKQPNTEIHINDVSESSDKSSDKSTQLTPFDFPRGAGPGTCLHGILENWDFISHDTLEDQVKKQLTYYGINPELVPMTINWMQQVVTKPLADAQCCLADISEKNRLVEMEFYLPMTEIRASGVMPLLKGRRLAFEPMRGQLKGFIDLIFRHEGRYYVADYKSNYLGDTIEDYHPEALQAAMEHHQYDLQYWIYSIAVDQYLSRRITNYDYETHFGGVYYFFLRGMSSNSNDTLDNKGVFFTRPQKSQLDKWKAWLLGSSVETKADNQQLGLF